MVCCASPTEVLNALAGVAGGVIAVDGFQASGKTTLAMQLGGSLGCPVVSADDFLDRNQGAFYAHLDLIKLSAAVAHHRKCIFEGVCCLQVLAGINVRPAHVVYVKRMAIWSWADEDELSQYELQGMSTAAPSNPVAQVLRDLWQEVASYHAQFRPHERADIVYQRSAA